MNVVFLQDNGINESLVLTEVSAFLRASGHHTALLLEREEPDFRAAIAAENPDLLFIPASIRGHHWVLNLCARLRRWFPGVPRVLAGSHPTFFPDILDFDDVPMILVGEVEEATVELLAALRGARSLESVRNLHFKRGRTVHRGELRPLWSDLDTLPLPHRELYYERYPFMARFPWKKFSSGRGCFHHCSYCYQPLYRAMCRGKGDYVRRKSPARVAEEIAAVAARYPLGNAHFSDDLFITSESWAEEFAAHYPTAVGIPYTVNSSAEFVTERTADLLAGSGCRAVAIGIETSDEGLRQQILKKDIDDETIRSAARLIRRRGMTLVTFNMLASPGESVDDALQTMRLNAEIGSHYARVGICFPIPKTRMAEEGLRDGVVSRGFGRDIYSRPDTGMDQLRVYFTTAEPDQGRFVNLLPLFNLGVSYPALIPLIQRAIALPPSRLFGLFGFFSLLKEKSLFGFSLLEGLDYFLHVGWPGERTTNFVSLV